MERDRFLSIHRLYEEQKFDDALLACEAALGSLDADTLISFADLMHILGLILYKKRNIKDGMECMQKALALYPICATKANIYGHLALMFYHEGLTDEAFDNYEKGATINKDDPSIIIAGKFLNKLKNKNLPGILLNTLPKSASIYIWSILRDRLNIQPAYIGLSFFQGDIVLPEKTKKFSEGNQIAQHHFSPTNRNLNTLKDGGIDRLIIHIREPRQAMLSWIHWIDNLKNRNNFVPSEYPLCDGYYNLSFDEQINCDRYFSQTLEQKIDWHIENYLHLLIKWIQDWLDVSKKK